MPVQGRPAEANLQHMFCLRVEDNDIAWFEKVSGLKDTSEVATAHAGGDASHAWQSPGKVTWNPLETESALTNNTELLKWRESVRAWADASSVSTTSPKKTCKLYRYAPGGKRLGYYNIVGAFPSEYSPGEWDASGTNFVREKCTIVYDSYKWVPEAA